MKDIIKMLLNVLLWNAVIWIFILEFFIWFNG